MSCERANSGEENIIRAPFTFHFYSRQQGQMETTK